MAVLSVILSKRGGVKYADGQNLAGSDEDLNRHADLCGDGRVDVGCLVGRGDGDDERIVRDAVVPLFLRTGAPPAHGGIDGDVGAVGQILGRAAPEVRVDGAA